MTLRKMLSVALCHVYYSHAQHDDVLVNDRPHIRQWFRKII